MGPTACIRSIRRTSDGQVRQATEFIIEMLQSSRRPEYVGLYTDVANGFQLHGLQREMFSQDGMLLWSEDPTGAAEGNPFDVFRFDPEACMIDVDNTLRLLRDNLKGEQLMGALMFSCGGRGPDARSLGER